MAGLLETPPDDGVLRSCWIKSHGRGFGKIPTDVMSISRSRSCNTGREMSGGLCYDTCPEGKGVGPVCWGLCPIGTMECGVLCLIPAETCSGMIINITKDVVTTGVKAVG